MNIIEKFELDQIERLTQNKEIPAFAPGDTIRVNVRIIEGSTERLQAFEGICIARRNRHLQSAFTVRKISHGEGVERTFPLYSPRIESIKVVRKGIVRRAKLYYLRGLTGKAARIQEKREFGNKQDKAAKEKKESIKKTPPVEAKKSEAKKPVTNKAEAKEKTTSKKDGEDKS